MLKKIHASHEVGMSKKGYDWASLKGSGDS
jgi:hypothetical protein